MNLILAFLAFLTWAVMAVISLFSQVKVFGKRTDNPIVKIFIGPFIIMTVGVFSFALGAIGASPVLLLLAGYGNWALAALIVLIFLSFFVKPQVNGDDVHWAIRPPLGLIFFVVGGSVLLILGSIMASPIILIILAL